MGSCCQSDPKLKGDFSVEHEEGRIIKAKYTVSESDLSGVTGLVLYYQRINSNGKYGEWNHSKLIKGEVNIKFYDNENLDIIVIFDGKDRKKFQIKIQNNPNIFTVYLGKETIIKNGKMSYNIKIMEEVLFNADKIPNKPNEPNK